MNSDAEREESLMRETIGGGENKENQNEAFRLFDVGSFQFAHRLLCFRGNSDSTRKYAVMAE